MKVLLLAILMTFGIPAACRAQADSLSSDHPESYRLDEVEMIFTWYQTPGPMWTLTLRGNGAMAYSLHYYDGEQKKPGRNGKTQISSSIVETAIRRFYVHFFFELAESYCTSWEPFVHDQQVILNRRLQPAAYGEITFTAGTFSKTVRAPVSIGESKDEPRDFWDLMNEIQMLPEISDFIDGRR